MGATGTPRPTIPGPTPTPGCPGTGVGTDVGRPMACDSYVSVYLLCEGTKNRGLITPVTATVPLSFAPPTPFLPSVWGLV